MTDNNIMIVLYSSPRPAKYASFLQKLQGKFYHQQIQRCFMSFAKGFKHLNSHDYFGTVGGVF